MLGAARLKVWTEKKPFILWVIAVEKEQKYKAGG